MFILGLQGSPRKGGNTDSLLAAFMEKAAGVGAACRTIQVARAGIAACKGCGYCERHGTCVIGDDPMTTEIYGLMRAADLIVAASPVYFYGVSAQLKGLIDRSQTLWSRKYVYKLKDPLASTRQGILFSVAASHGRQLFDGIHLTVNYFFDAIDARLSHALTYRGIEAKGAIRNQKDLAADLDAIIDACVRPQMARKKVLFVSQTGACRAPMAAALAQRRHAERVRTGFAALSPAPALAASMVRTMQQNGLDVAYRRPATVDEGLHGDVPDLVVVVDEAVTDQPVPGVNTVRWSLTSPEASEDLLDRLFDQIEERVDKLSASID